MSNDLLRRRNATAKTQSKYQGTSFSWTEARSCVHLARYQMRNMGHRVPTMPRFRSALTAKRALKTIGADSVIELFDGLLPRIAPSQMKLGDLAAFQGVEGLDAVMVNVAPRKMMGWHDHAETMIVLDIDWDDVAGAWRL